MAPRAADRRRREPGTAVCGHGRHFPKWLIFLGWNDRDEGNAALSVRYSVGFWQALPVIDRITQPPGFDRELFRPISGVCGHCGTSGRGREGLAPPAPRHPRRCGQPRASLQRPAPRVGCTPALPVQADPHPPEQRIRGAPQLPDHRPDPPPLDQRLLAGSHSPPARRISGASSRGAP
jgi:hypothetical protein